MGAGWRLYMTPSAGVVRDQPVTVRYLTDCTRMKDFFTVNDVYNNKLMKGKALRKHSLHEKTAASVLLKLFISGNK